HDLVGEPLGQVAQDRPAQALPPWLGDSGSIPFLPAQVERPIFGDICSHTDPALGPTPRLRSRSRWRYSSSSSTPARCALPVAPIMRPTNFSPRSPRPATAGRATK